jgi:5'-nucleotidase
VKRRRFLRVAGAGTAGSLLLPGWAQGSELPGGETRIVILHTNDTHSRMDPFPMDGGRFQGLGGAARRATLIERVRAEHPNVLLLDSGDIFQGTPYFNFFKGEIEFRAMSAMDYDVATIGNHDFDNGIEGLVEMMPHATFDFVSANYDCGGSPLEPHVRPWVIREIGGVRVGIFGLGIAFEGLVLPSLHEGVRYTDPYAAARRAVAQLRSQGCSLIICLSHLGYRYGGEIPSDTILAQRVEGIDLILGGHTHTFMDEPDVYLHESGGRTVVNQVGWGGMRLGRIDVILGPRASEGTDPQVHHQTKSWRWTSYPIDEMLD